MKANQDVIVCYTIYDAEVETPGIVLSVSELPPPLAMVKFELHHPGLHNTFIACFFYKEQENRWNSSFFCDQTIDANICGFYLKPSLVSQNSGTDSLPAAE